MLALPQDANATLECEATLDAGHNAQSLGHARGAATPTPTLPSYLLKSPTRSR